jgi:hypothetical protein
MACAGHHKPNNSGTILCGKVDAKHGKETGVYGNESSHGPWALLETSCPKPQEESVKGRDGLIDQTSHQDHNDSGYCSQCNDHETYAFDAQIGAKPVGERHNERVD